MKRELYVHIQLPGTLGLVPAARLEVETLPEGIQLGRFRYGDKYLQRRNAVALDPYRLPLGDRMHEFTKLRGIPGAVRDAGPDAWGRRVIENELQRPAGDLDEIDYLLHGPQDGAGNLAFGLNPSPPVPVREYNRTQQLADLIAAADAVESGKQIPVQLKRHMQPGTSMGGARPKATIEDENTLWLGKFPSRDDPFNIQRVEYATLLLAQRSGLNAAHARIQSVAQQEVLMVRRFDRDWTEDGYLRFGLVSGLTILDADENYLSREVWSYPLLAEEVGRWSTQPKADRAELFRRMVFNAAITNNDDHPRNHAMILSPKGWRLSPAYDLVPNPVPSQERRDLALTVGAYGRNGSVYNLISRADAFGLSPEEAKAQIEGIVSGVQGWQEYFRSCGVSDADILYVAAAFLPQSFFFERPPEDVLIT